MKFHVQTLSRQGKRRYNEDRIAWTGNKEAILLVVADGMGGHLHGDLAAQVVIDEVTYLFEQMAQPKISDPHRFLSLALMTSHERILQMSMNRRFPEVPSTTALAVLIQDGLIYSAHAGDTRFYIFEQGVVTYRTQDHSAIAQLLKNGTILPEEANSHPDRNRLYNCLGAVDKPRISLSDPIALSPEAVLLLCSDGLWSSFQDEELAQAFLHKPFMPTLERVMIEAEKRSGAHADNLSAILFGCHNPGNDASEIDQQSLPLRANALAASVQSEQLAEIINT